MDKTSLGDRMKRYEKVHNIQLMQRTPIIIRLDGKAFHTYTKGFTKPFDEDLALVREATLEYLCENIQGCIFGYSQSDEISLVLKNYETFQTQGWFDNKLQKIVSVAASMCTAEFNRLAKENNTEKFKGLALFDARAFSLPRDEVVNYLIWRQQDWERNSIQMCAQSKMQHSDLQNKSCKELVTILEKDYDLIWGNLPSKQKRGEFWTKRQGLFNNTPLFKFKETACKVALDHAINLREG